jgi:RsmE family RNA methyltransferase
MGKAEVLVVSPEYLEMRVELTEPPPKPLPLTLIVAMPRPKSFMKCLEVATVLGIKKMYFMHSFRVEKHYWGSARLSQDYIRDHLLLGLEQARDTVLPAIEFKRRFKPFVEDELPALVKGTRALAAHPYGAAPCPYHVERPVTLAIGPEGGFIPYEVDMLKAVGFEDVSVGERILRVEHAVAALIGRIV